MRQFIVGVAVGASLMVGWAYAGRTIATLPPIYETDPGESAFVEGFSIPLDASQGMLAASCHYYDEASQTWMRLSSNNFIPATR